MSETFFKKGSVFIVSLDNQDFKHLACLPHKEDKYSEVFRIKNGKVLRYLEDTYLGPHLWRVFEIIDSGDQVIISDNWTKHLEHINHR